MNNAKVMQEVTAVTGVLKTSRFTFSELITITCFSEQNSLFYLRISFMNEPMIDF